MTMNFTEVECIILVSGHLCIIHEGTGTRSTILVTAYCTEQRCKIEQSPSFLVDTYLKQRNAFDGWRGGKSVCGHSCEPLISWICCSPACRRKSCSGDLIVWLVWQD